MSVLRYNGITLPYSITTSFSQEDVYDDLSGTDWMCSKYDITVQCHIDLAYISSIAPKYAGFAGPDNSAEIMKIIRKDLMQPRRHLSFLFNGRELIPADTAPAANSTVGAGTVDVMNGPKPQSCTYNRLNNVHYILNYHIIAHYWENLTDGSILGQTTNQPGHVALYNRWTETVEIDDMMSTTRIRDGKYVIRSDNHKGYTADEIRSDLAVVGCPTGFIRKSAKYTISPDGLGLSYYIVDKEQFKKFPPYAYDASGTYTETATKMSAKRHGEINLRLKGAPNKAISPQNELIRIGMLIINRKLRSRGYDKDTGNGFAEIEQIKVNMYENEVDFYWRVMIPVSNERANGAFANNEQRQQFISTLTALGPGGAIAGGLLMIGNGGTISQETYPVDTTLPKTAAFTGDMCTTPLSDDTPNSAPPRYLDRGSYGYILQAAKYWDPDIPDTVLAPDNIIDPTDKVTSIDNVQHNHGVKVGRAGVERES